MYDAVIIGSGLSGLMAARELKKNESNFVCLDARPKTGEPLRCGEGIREKEFLDIFGRTNYKFVLNKVDKHKIIYGKEKDVHEAYLELDKIAFEKWLAKPIKKYIKQSVICRNVKITKDYVEVETTEGKIRCKILIIASGPSYILQKKLGLVKTKPKVISCYGGVYSNFKLDRKTFYFYYDKEEKGYFWAFPKGNGKVNLGYAGWEKNVKESFTGLMSKYGFSELKLEKKLGGIFPVSGPIEKTYGYRVLVTGTAAGLNHACTGEGNCFALKSGILAGRTAAEALRDKNFSKGFMKRYEERWKNELGKRVESGFVAYTLEEFGMKFGIMDKIFDNTQEEDIRRLIISDTPKKAKIASRAIRMLNMLSPTVNKDSIRFKFLMFSLKMLKRIGIL